MDLIRTFISADGLKSKLFRRGVVNLVISVTSTLLSFVMAVLLARFMGAEQYGIYTYFYEILMILSIPAQFGLPALLVRETAKELENKAWGSIKGLWRWSGNVTAVITSIVAASIVIYLLAIDSSTANTYIPILLWGLALVPLTSFAGLRGAALRGLHKVILGQLPEMVILPGLFVIFIILYNTFSLNSLSPSSTLMLQSIAAVIAFIIGAVLLMKAAPPEIKPAVPVTKKKLWLNSVFSLAMLSGIDVLNKRITIVLLGLLATASQIGIFKVSLQLATLADFGIRVLNPVLAPEVSRLYTKGDHDQLQKLATISTRMIMVINFIITLGFVLIGRLFLGFFFGPDFIVSYEVVIILLIGQLVNSSTGAVAVFLNMTGHEKDTAKARGISLFLTVFLTLLLTPRWGMMGTAVGITIAMIVWNVILWRKAWQKIKINTLPFTISF